MAHLSTASPQHASENELGVLAPAGFWEPAGFTTDGGNENFNRRRSGETKPGLACMLATSGYITPGVTDKFLGSLSTPAGLNLRTSPMTLRPSTGSQSQAERRFWPTARSASVARALAGSCPNSLMALSKVPGAGRAYVPAYVAICESSSGLSEDA